MDEVIYCFLEWLIDIEITKREVLASITIFFIMIFSGLYIDEIIYNKLLEKYQVYDTAMQIDNDKSLFEHGMDTDIGNSFVYGELKSVDTVSLKEIDGEYARIKKVKERYTMHTRTVRSGKTTHVQTYWTWDYAGEETIHCNKITFIGCEFDYEKIKFPSEEYIKTIKTSPTIRYKYYVNKTSYIGTLFSNLNSGTINDSSFYKEKTIPETIESLESGNEHIFFWIAWFILMIVVIYAFCKFENRWLED